MPTYEYECRDCSHKFERFQTITAKPARTCPECRGRVTRLLGAGAAVIMKGGSADVSVPCGRQGPCCGADSPCLQRP